MKILITGSNGLLGQKIILQLLNRDVEFLATSLGENRNPKCPDSNYTSLDISNQSQVNAVIKEYLPDYIIHTAAITNVDYCEENVEECRNINVEGSNILFNVCQEINAHFMLLSTDFVFDGEKGNYSETDAPNPLSVYARSKFDAEQILVQSEYASWSIVRTIIVFGEGINLSRSNIVLWAKEALAVGKPLTIIDDQYRSPTWADDLAWACIRICELNKNGIYHISGPERMSIFDLVLRIAKYHNLDTSSVQKTDSESLNQPAKRPPCTGFNLAKAENELGYRPKSFEECLHLLS